MIWDFYFTPLGNREEVVSTVLKMLFKINVKYPFLGGWNWSRFRASSCLRNMEVKTRWSIWKTSGQLCSHVKMGALPLRAKFQSAYISYYCLLQWYPNGAWASQDIHWMIHMGVKKIFKFFLKDTLKLKYNLHPLKCTHVQCTVWLVLTNAYFCEAHTPSKALNVSITQQSYLISGNCFSKVYDYTLVWFDFEPQTKEIVESIFFGFCNVFHTAYSFFFWDSSLLLNRSKVLPCNAE